MLVIILYLFLTYLPNMSKLSQEKNYHLFKIIHRSTILHNVYRLTASLSKINITITIILNF